MGVAGELAQHAEARTRAQVQIEYHDVGASPRWLPSAIGFTYRRFRSVHIRPGANQALQPRGE